MTYLLDTSAWVSYLRDRDTDRGDYVDRLIEADLAELITCPAVRMELALDPQELRRRRLLRFYDGLPSTDVVADDFDLAATIYRSVRRRGHTVRSLTDCLIAAAALRTGATVVHDDVDFDRMAATIGDLSVERLPGSPFPPGTDPG